MKIDEFNKEMDSLFGKRHHNIPSSGIDMGTIGMEAMPIKQFVSNYTKLLTMKLSTYSYTTKELMPLILNEWWIKGDKKCRFWLNHYACDTAKDMVTLYEKDNDIEIWVPEKYKGAPDIEKLCFKYTVLTTLSILDDSKEYQKAKPDDNITSKLLIDITKTAREYGN